MKLRTAGQAAIVAAIMLGSSRPLLANIDILVDNIGEPTRDVVILGSDNQDQIWAAQAFTTPAHASLNYAVLLIGLVTGEPEITAELRAGPDPTGPLVAMLSVDALSISGLEPTNLVPITPALLEPGVTYWVVLGVSSNGSVSWAFAEGETYFGPGALGGYAYSEDLGATWGPIGFRNLHQMRIEVTFAPCPADLNGDGLVDFSDYLEFLNLFDVQDLRVDFNMDGLVDFSDYLEFLNLYDAGC